MCLIIIERKGFPSINWSEKEKNVTTRVLYIHIWRTREIHWGNYSPSYPHPGLRFYFRSPWERHSPSTQSTNLPQHSPVCPISPQLTGRHPLWMYDGPRKSTTGFTITHFNPKVHALPLPSLLSFIFQKTWRMWRTWQIDNTISITWFYKKGNCNNTSPIRAAPARSNNDHTWNRDPNFQHSTVQYSIVWHQDDNYVKVFIRELRWKIQGKEIMNRRNDHTPVVQSETWTRWLKREGTWFV